MKINLNYKKIGKTILSLLFLTSTFIAIAQNKPSISLINTSLVGTENQLPFWFTANQLGKIEGNNQFINLSELNIQQNISTKNQKLGFHWGSSIIGGINNKSYLQINQAYAGATYRGWQLTGGLFADEELYGGLSSSNGNIARSLNARPYPKIRFGTTGFLPIFSSKVFSFKAEYDEGLLNDDRFVDHLKMHHKSLTISIIPNSKWDFRIGLEHFIMWGGISPVERIGQMPQSFKDYLLYITASKGDEEFPMGEQINVAGNHLGSYQFHFIRKFDAFEATLYLSHPFEDFSGVNWFNWPDNLLGLNIEFKNKEQAVNHLLVEFINTRQQSIRGDFWYWDESKQKMLGRENDKYYYHYIYRSGYTYHQKIMALPLFEPVFSEDKSMVIPSNRFYAFHLGAKGRIIKHLAWKGMFTYGKYIGTYLQPYEPPVNKINTLLALNYSQPNRLPFDIGLFTAFDFNSTTSNRAGFGFQLSKTW